MERQHDISMDGRKVVAKDGRSFDMNDAIRGQHANAHAEQKHATNECVGVAKFVGILHGLEPFM